MFGNIFRNIPDVTKNLLIINALFFLATVLFEGQGMNLYGMLGMHYPGSNYFEPYQIVTHFFMHGSFMHILFNMFGLVVFGSHLERIWGKKRFLIFYFATALGAAFLHAFVQGIEIYQVSGQLFPELYIDTPRDEFSSLINYVYDNDVIQNPRKVATIYATTSLGASGAIYGLITAFAMLFPNTELMLLFPPIPIKAKWLALILGGIALYMGYMNAQDSIAHFAHLGGMLFGFILVKFWQRNRNDFY